jgi:hypothetical protein
MKLSIERIRLTGPARSLIFVIGLHSSILGSVMLFVPNSVLPAFGFEQQRPPFFPAQSGLFLLILGVCYFASLRLPQLILVILVSKVSAVVFLVTFGVILGVPLSIWLAAAGDGAMLAALILVLRSGARSACRESFEKVRSSSSSETA